LFLLLFTPRTKPIHIQEQNPTNQPEQESQVTVPSRPSQPRYHGAQGEQRSDILFSPSDRIVTIKLRVEDPNGYFLTNLRPENFAVYEDGVRQKNVIVNIEHAPISLTVLMEFGGRYVELNKVLWLEVPQVGRQLLSVIEPDDKIAIFNYNDKVQTLVDFNQPHSDLDQLFDQLSDPGFSEANFYDAIIETLHRTQEIKGRKALLVISSGLDTFSKANYQRVLRAAQDSSTPIYAIGLVRSMQREAEVYGPKAPISRIDWMSAEDHLESLARASGGRAYVLDSDAEIPAIYDDIMENLRIRYVASYMSANNAASGPPRKIHVELIDPITGEALKIRDSNGKPITAKVYVQESYSPG